MSRAAIGSVTLRTVRGVASDTDSSIAAASIGRVNLGGVRFANGGTTFGVAADQIGSLTGADAVSGKRLALHKLTPSLNVQSLLAAQGISADFVVRLV